jgi:hypothetical protein
MRTETAGMLATAEPAVAAAAIVASTVFLR